jgi:hypothetical protein
MKKKYFFGWENAKRVLKDIYATLSAKDSFLSSKKLTTFVANASVVLLSWIFILYMTYKLKLTATDFAIAISPLTLMGGYNIAMGLKAKKEEGTTKLADKKEDNKQATIEKITDV